jgi:hypothetical protein
MSTRCWRCAIWPVMSAGGRAGGPSGSSGARTSKPAAHNGPFALAQQAARLLLCPRQRSAPLSLLLPVSERFQCSLFPSRGPSLPHLNPVHCVLLRPIRGDGLCSAVVPLRRAVWVLQKSHAHPEPFCRHPVITFTPQIKDRRCRELVSTSSSLSRGVLSMEFYGVLCRPMKKVKRWYSLPDAR